MIAMTIGLFLLGTLALVLFNNSRTRYELEKSIGQIQNARYALQVLSDDLANAGFYAETKPENLNATGPICLDIDDLDENPLPVAVLGLNNIKSANRPGCAPEALEDMDVLTVRRASSCSVGTDGCDVFLTGLPHIQKSGCNPSEQPQIKTTREAFNGTVPPCDATTPTSAPIYRLLSHVYYLRNITVSSQAVPTLMRAELTADGYQSIPIAEGIEHLHFEYGIDTNDNGEPNEYQTANDITETNWSNVVAVRVYLIARNLKPTNGYQDDRTYQLGTQPVTPDDNDKRFKRQAYSTTIRLNNIAGSRENST